MGASIPLPALSVRAPEVPDVLQKYAQVQQIKNAQLQSAGLAQENQQRQQQIDTTKAANTAYQNALKVDPASGRPSIDTDSLQKELAANGHGSAIPGILENVTKWQKADADKQEAQGKVQQAARDSLGYLGSAIQQANYDPKLADLFIEQRLSTPGVPAAEAAQLQQARQQLQQNPAGLKTMADNFVAQSKAVRETAAQELQAKARMTGAGKQPEGELPLGDKVQQYNQLLSQRWQVLNPNQPLPSPYTLGPDATQKDYDRIDKSLGAREAAQGTQAQRETANEIRNQSAQLAKQNQQDREDKEGMQPVVGQDANGKDVLVSAADAKKLGLTGTMKADADLVNKSHAARTWVGMASKQAPAGAPPEAMGIMQLVDKLDKDGKLGAVASRWNDFLAGKFGEGDRDYSALRAKMGLSATKLMQAHVGSRGGAFMLEHFEDLANAKKMDAQTLRAGLGSELDYMKDVAMLPSQGGSGAKSADPFAQFGGVAHP